MGSLYAGYVAMGSFCRVWFNPRLPASDFRLLRRPGQTLDRSTMPEPDPAVVPTGIPVFGMPDSQQVKCRPRLDICGLSQRLLSIDPTSK